MNKYKLISDNHTHDDCSKRDGQRVMSGIKVNFIKEIDKIDKMHMVTVQKNTNKGISL